MGKLRLAERVALIGVVLAFSGVCAAGCSPQSPDQATASSGQEIGSTQTTDAVAWSLDIDCVMCHSAEGATMEDSTFGATTHVQQAQATCATCHADEKALAAVHEGKTATDAMPKKLKKTTVDASTCQAAGCHDEGADERIALTADYTELTDTRGTQVNPHEVMGLTEGHSDITCSNCHNMHATEVTAAETCVSCHHAGVYECNTCH